MFWRSILLYGVGAFVFVSAVMGLISAMPAALMYTGVGFFGTMFAPFLASKIVVPFLLSPRRPYAGVLGVVHDPWVPPSAGLRGVMSVVLMTAWLYILNSFVCRLIMLNAKGSASDATVHTLALKLTLQSVAIYFAIHCIPFLKMLMTYIPVPLFDDLATGIPMAVLNLIMLWVFYGDSLLDLGTTFL
jgi:hypothetical protein